MSSRTVWTVALNLLAFVVVLKVLREASGVIQWLLIALFIALALQPAVHWLIRKGMPRGLALTTVVALALAVVALLAATMIPMLIEQGEILVRSAPALLERLRDSGPFRWADEQFQLIDRAQTEVTERARGAAGPLVKIAAEILHKLAACVAIFVLTVFMLVFGGDLYRGVLGWLPPDRRGHVQEVMARVHRSVAGYVAGSLMVATIGGVVTSVTLLLLGVPYFLPLGLAMLILGLIPFLGAFVGAVLVVGTTFLSAGPKAGLIALAVFLAYQQAENHLLQPLIQRHTIRMNPLIIAIVMLIGTSFAGVLGALLALPVGATLQIVAEDHLKRRRASWGETG